MKLTDYSRHRLMGTFSKWEVAKDFADPMYNYLVNGFSPGGFFTAVLSNDFHGAIVRSHPSNTVQALKMLSGWIGDCMPKEAYGSYETVSNWLYMNSELRRKILEENDLIYTEDKELWMCLEGKRSFEPMLY